MVRIGRPALQMWPGRIVPLGGFIIIHVAGTNAQGPRLVDKIDGVLSVPSRSGNITGRSSSVLIYAELPWTLKDPVTSLYCERV